MQIFSTLSTHFQVKNSNARFVIDNMDTRQT